MRGGILYEHGHRMIAGVVGLLTLGLAILFWRREPRRPVRYLAVAAFGLIVVQAVLGGITVLFYLPAWVSTAHAAVAQLFFCTVVSLVLLTDRWWVSEATPLEPDDAARTLRWLSWTTAGALFIQLVLGAAFRHQAFGLLPHLVGAFVVTALTGATVGVTWARFRSVRPLWVAAGRLMRLLAVQLVLGGLAYWAVELRRQAPQPLPLPVALTVAHVVTGALTLAAALWLALCVERVTRIHPVATSSSALWAQSSLEPSR